MMRKGTFFQKNLSFFGFLQKKSAATPVTAVVFRTYTQERILFECYFPIVALHHLPRALQSKTHA